MRGLTPAERDYLSDDSGSPSTHYQWVVLRPLLIADGRARMAGEAVVSTDLGCLALRVCPVGEFA